MPAENSVSASLHRTQRLRAVPGDGQRQQRHHAVRLDLAEALDQPARLGLAEPDVPHQEPRESAWPHLEIGLDLAARQHLASDERRGGEDALEVRAAEVERFAELPGDVACHQDLT